MKLIVASFMFLSVGIFSSGFTIAQTQGTVFSGRVDRVWEDGFQLTTGERSITIDSYDICGDNTNRHITVADKVTVTGEFEEGEFDAFSIMKANGTVACN